MKKRILLLSVYILTLVLPVLVMGQSGTIPETLITSFKAGNAKELSGFLNASVEMVVLDNENIYSKAQAEQVLYNFFLKNKPTSFRIIHEGGKPTAKYAIGILSTENAKYRIYFLLKANTDKSLIHQLRIELENGNE